MTRIKLLTKDSDYAVRALVHLARSGGAFVPSAEIARKEGIPVRFLRQVLRKLIQGKLVRSREGAAGGVTSGRDPEEIRLDRVIALFQGELRLSNCMFRKALCPRRATCALRARIRGIENMVAREFRSITIASLARDREKEPRAAYSEKKKKTGRSL